MKKTKSMLLRVVLGIALFIASCYVIYKTWDVFGFWRILLTGLISWCAFIPLSRLAKARSEKEGKIVYNTKEWPMGVSMLISAGIAYYLYSFLESKGIVGYDYTFGIIYLLLFSAAPIVFNVYRLIRNRNDFVSIGHGKIEFRDNDKRGVFEIEAIKNMEMDGAKGLTLHLKDGSSRFIDLSNMNFGLFDLVSIITDLQKLIPEKEKDAAQK